MNIPELTAEIERQTALWNGIDQEPAVRIRDLCHERAIELQRLGGCCGEQRHGDVEIIGEHGQLIETRHVVTCPWSFGGDTHCPAAKGGGLFPSLANVLEAINEVEKVMQ